MKRGIITNNGHGIHISDGEVWMTVWEIADLFYTTVGSINSRLKAILKANVLKKYDICQCIKLENGNSADVYNLNMIIAIPVAFALFLFEPVKPFSNTRDKSDAFIPQPLSSITNNIFVPLS